MHVKIIELETNRVVVVVPVVLHAANYTSEWTEYFDEAWRAVVDDGDVDANERQRYRFELQNPNER